MNKMIKMFVGLALMILVISCSQHQHIYVDQWSFNETQHWKNSSCEHVNEKDYLSNHSFVDEECECGMIYGLEFSLNSDNTYEIVKYNGNKEHIKLPSHFNDLPITTIGKGAFYSNYLYSVKLISIEIPQGITSIKEKAFRMCYYLESILLPDGLLSIGNGAFDQCKKLTNINFPKSITNIGESAFGDCKSIIELNIPDSVIEIGEQAFANCDNLKSITLPSQIKILPEYMLYGCSNLTNVIIPNSVTTIKNGVFRGCISLSKVFIPDSVKEVGEDIFYKCYNVIINCEYSEKPDCWNNIEFNQEDRPEEWGDYWDGWGTVVWGYSPEN